MTRHGRLSSITSGDGPEAIAKLVEEICRRQSELAAGRRSETFVVHGVDGRALSVAQQPMDDDGWVATYEDVTQHQSVERQVRFLAHHDPLTGLANRMLFNLQITEALQALDAIRKRASRPAVRCFTSISIGSRTSTTRWATRSATHCSKPSRRGCGPVSDQQDFVARLGGDEFAVACRSPDAIACVASALSATIIESLGVPPSAIADRTVSIGVSIGIALAESRRP